MSDNASIHAALTDSTFRGAVALPDGRVGLLFEGGTILAVSRPQVLSAFESERILDAATHALASASATLAAIGNVSGPERERNAHAFAEVAGEPTFLHEYDAIGVAGGNDRKFRDEQLAREIPDV